MLGRCGEPEGKETLRDTLNKSKPDKQVFKNTLTSQTHHLNT